MLAGTIVVLDENHLHRLSEQGASIMNFIVGEKQLREHCTGPGDWPRQSPHKKAEYLLVTADWAGMFCLTNNQTSDRSF